MRSLNKEEKKYKKTDNIYKGKVPLHKKQQYTIISLQKKVSVTLPAEHA